MRREGVGNRNYRAYSSLSRTGCGHFDFPPFPSFNYSSVSGRSTHAHFPPVALHTSSPRRLSQSRPREDSCRDRLIEGANQSAQSSLISSIRAFFSSECRNPTGNSTATFPPSCITGGTEIATISPAERRIFQRRARECCGRRSGVGRVNWPVRTGSGLL